MEREAIAKICHEVNRGLCTGTGDSSQVAWEDATEDIRESARAGVDAILQGTVARPEDAHAHWSNWKRALGWEYGHVKDPIAKTHPSLLPFDSLPATEQLKDLLFFDIVTKLRDS